MIGEMESVNGNRPHPTGFESLSDKDLLEAARTTAQSERGTVASMIRQLCEISHRRLYAKEGYKTMFLYCVKELGLSEGESYRRVLVSEVCIKYPPLFEAIADGRIHLASLALIAPHLTDNNWKELLEKASRKSKREVERMVAPFLCRPRRPDRVSFLGPALREDGTLDKSDPLVEIAFSTRESVLKKIERIRDLMRSKNPDVQLEHAIIAGAEEWLERNDPDRIIARKMRRKPKCPGKSPRAKKSQAQTRDNSFKKSIGNTSRRIPQAIKDHAYDRDGGQCTYISPSGNRCEARVGLEYDHRTPFASGGRSDNPENIRLLCRTHNQQSARDFYGNKKIDESIAAGQERKAPEMHARDP